MEKVNESLCLLLDKKERHYLKFRNELKSYHDVDIVDGQYNQYLSPPFDNIENGDVFRLIEKYSPGKIELITKPGTISDYIKLDTPEKLKIIKSKISPELKYYEKTILSIHNRGITERNKNINKILDEPK